MRKETTEVKTNQSWPYDKTVVKTIEETKAPYQSGNSQLLIDYRETLIKAYELGEDIKKLYGIVPPNLLFDTDFVNTTHRDPN
jgi:hypothetical protein